MNDLIIRENHPISNLKYGQTTAIIPDVTSKDLIPREFTVTNLGEIYRIVESENSSSHHIPSNLMQDLGESGLDDDEICELFITIHESLFDDSFFKKTDTLREIFLEILNNENPLIFLKNIKDMDKEDIVSIFMSEAPYSAYKELTSTYYFDGDEDEDEYEDEDETI